MEVQIIPSGSNYNDTFCSKLIVLCNNITEYSQHVNLSLCVNCKKACSLQADLTFAHNSTMPWIQIIFCGKQVEKAGTCRCVKLPVFHTKHYAYFQSFLSTPHCPIFPQLNTQLSLNFHTQ